MRRKRRHQRSHCCPGKERERWLLVGQGCAIEEGLAAQLPSPRLRFRLRLTHPRAVPGRVHRKDLRTGWTVVGRPLRGSS